MTEFSMLPWETQTGTGDGAFAYNQDQANEFFRDFINANGSTAGVLYGIDNMLEVTGSATPLQVDTGKAVCYSRYWNDAAMNVSVTVPAADMGFAVVLQTDWSTNATRVAVKTSGSGVTTIPSLTQTAGTTWEVYLATGVIDNAGNIWTDSTKTTAGVTDARAYAISPTSGMVKLRHILASGTGGTVNIDNLQTDLSGLQIHILGSKAIENAAGGAAPWFYDMTFNNITTGNYTWMTDHTAGGALTQLTNNSDTRFKNVLLAPFLAGLAASTRDQMRAVIDIVIPVAASQATATHFHFSCLSSYVNTTGPLYYQARSSGIMATAINTKLTSIQILENATYQLKPNIEVMVYGYR